MNRYAAAAIVLILAYAAGNALATYIKRRFGA